MELWGLCPECVRWFYLPAPTGSMSTAEWSCPVCGEEPVSLDNRAAEHADSGLDTPSA